MSTSVIPCAVSCAEPGCSSIATYVGDVKTTFFLGWGMDAKETALFCPVHHPMGPEQALVQAAAARIFLKVANLCDPSNPKFSAKLVNMLRQVDTTDAY